MLDGKGKREFFKRRKSPKWKDLNKQFLEEVSLAKESYRSNIVDDLKFSNPKNWYSKVKRMGGMDKGIHDETNVEEIANLSNEIQANKIADYFGSTRNQYDKLKKEDFSDYFKNYNYDEFAENFVTPQQIENVISRLNKKSACVLGDLPMKIICLFSKMLSKPICNLINTMFEKGVYPQFWKRKLITLIPKCYPTPSVDKLRPISGIYNC